MIAADHLSDHKLRTVCGRDNDDIFARGIWFTFRIIITKQFTSVLSTTNHSIVTPFWCRGRWLVVAVTSNMRQILFQKLRKVSPFSAVSQTDLCCCSVSWVMTN